MPEEMPSYASRWAKLIYPLLVHSAHKIRERSAFAIQLGLPALKAHRAEIISTLIPDLKAALVPEMVKLFAGRQELHVLRIWGYFVTILGKVSVQLKLMIFIHENIGYFLPQLSCPIKSLVMGLKIIICFFIC